MDSYREYNIIFWFASLYSSFVQFSLVETYSKHQPHQLAGEEKDLLSMDWDTHIFDLASTGIFKITLGL